ncbi:hypothetical protein GCM10009745_20650 [Kribbella yunnanensis]|uniref:Uncharacterized protein n=1 Tax=Kribbella yunnanensis TaxID=190194 RepID=A0ABN2GUS5_9ACTN
MSRTKKSGSTAHRASNASTSPGSDPTVMAVRNRADESPALNTPTNLSTALTVITSCTQ